MTDSKEFKNTWLKKFYEDLKQNKFNLIKTGLYMGQLEKKTEELIKILKDDYEL